MAHYRGVYGEPSRAGFVGQLVHRLIARDYQSGPIDDVAQAAREEIGSTHLNFDLGQAVGKPSDIKRVIAEAGETYARFCQLPRPELSEVEVSVNVEAGNDVKLRGRIDGVHLGDDRVRILDWKTGPIRPEAELQLGFYGLLWALDRKTIPTELEAFSIQTGERATFESGIARLNVVAREVADLVHQVRQSWKLSGSMERHAGPWCRYCPVLDACDEGRETVALLS